MTDDRCRPVSGYSHQCADEIAYVLRAVVDQPDHVHKMSPVVWPGYQRLPVFDLNRVGHDIRIALVKISVVFKVCKVRTGLRLDSKGSRSNALYPTQFSTRNDFCS